MEHLRSERRAQCGGVEVKSEVAEKFLRLELSLRLGLGIG